MIQPAHERGSAPGESLLMKYGLPSNYYVKNVRAFMEGRDKIRPNRINLSKVARNMKDFALIHFEDSLAVNFVDEKTASLSDLTHSLDFSLQTYRTSSGTLFGTLTPVKTAILKEKSFRAYNAIIGIYFPEDVLFMTEFQRGRDAIRRDGGNSGPNLPRGWGFGF